MELGMINTILNWIDVVGLPLTVAAIGAYLYWYSTTETKQITEIERQVLEQGKLLKRITLISLKTEMLHEQFPIEDRMKAYAQYKDLGGNGFIDAYYNEILLPEASRIARKIEQDK